MMKRTLLMVFFTTLLLSGGQWMFAQKTTTWRAQMDQNSPEKLSDIRQTFDDYWATKNRTRKTKGYKQFKRHEDFWQHRLDESGNYPNPMHLYQEWLKYRNSNLAKSGNLKSSTNGDWSYVGPTTLPQGSNAAYAGMGRVNAITFNPNNTSEIWVGSPSGGLWKSTTGGTSWAVVADDLPTLGVSDIVIDHTNTNTIYIATGDADGAQNYSLGVMKSTDGGATWNTTGLNYMVTQTRQVARLLMHPNNNMILIAATSNGIMRTTDGGTNWTAATNNDMDMDDNAFRDLEFKPNDPNTVYAGSDRGSIFKSTDNGATWSLATYSDANDYKGWVRLAVSAADANSVYALVDDGNGNLHNVMRSNDSGANWATVFTGNTENLLGGQGNYDLAFVAAPNNANLIYIGGVDLYKSTNGGSSFSKIADDAGDAAPYVHGDHHTLVFEPGTDNLFTGHDGGVQKTTITNDAVWTDLSNGLFITQFYRLGLSQQNVNLILAGAQDNDVSYFNGTTWANQNNLSDGMECLFDSGNSNIAYTSSQEGYLQRTTDNFVNVSDITAGSNAVWTIPFVLDPSNSSTIFAGYEQIHKSTDMGDNWTTITTTSLASSSWEHIAIPASDANTIYASAGAQIFRTTNGGSNWTAINTGLPSESITYIATHNTNPQKLWVTTAGLNAGQKVYASTDGGSNWTNISGSLPNVTAKCIVFQNGSTDEGIYVGTDLGVFYRNNSMTDWQTFSMGMPNVIVSELEIHYASGKIRAATFGRGVWESDLFSSAPTLGALVNVKAYLQGAHNNGTMSTTLKTNNLIPTAQPFNTASWNYAGTESVADMNAIPANAVDWILVEVRSASDNSMVVASRAGFLLSNGSIVDMDGSSPLSFPTILVNTPYHLAIKSRHHLSITTAATHTFPAIGTSGTMPIDLTMASNVMNGAASLVDLGGGNHGLKAGDFNGDGAVSVADFNIYTGQSASLYMYLNADANLDGAVTVTDYNLYQGNASSISTISIMETIPAVD
ncbi:MAG: VPS10 domain-containing protein [Chitinophagales bacterium]